MGNLARDTSLNGDLDRQVAPQQLSQERAVIASYQKIKNFQGDNLREKQRLLGDVLCEIASLHRDLVDARRIPMAVMVSRCQGPDGTPFSAKDIYKEFAITRFRLEHPKIKRIQDEEIPNYPEYAPGVTLRKLFSERFGVRFDSPVREHLNGRLDCSKLSFNFEKVKKNSLEQFHELLHHILEGYFTGDVFEMTYSVVMDLCLVSKDGKERLGHDILAGYAGAAFLKEFPDRPSVKRQELNNSRDFSPKAMLEKFRIGAARVQAGLEVPTFETAMLEKYQSESPRTIQTIQSILTEIFNIRCQKDPARFTYSSIHFLKLRSPNGYEVGMQSLLAEYSLLRFIHDFPEKSGQTRVEVITTRGYRLSDSLEWFKREGLLVDRFPKRFEEFTREDTQDFLRVHNLEKVVQALGENPTVLIDGLAMLAPDIFEGRDVGEFVRSYVGLKVQRSLLPSDDILRSGSEHYRNPFIEALLHAAQSGHAHQLGKQNLKEATMLFIRTSRLDFERSPEKFISWLSERCDFYKGKGSELPPAFLTPVQIEFLSILYSEAAKYFQEIKDFKITCAKREPFPYQREGVRFLVQRNRAILADDAGLGKTYQAAVAALERGLNRVLWITTAPNKSSVKEEIQADVNLSDHDIAIISSESPLQRKKQIDQLNGEHFIVINYETLVALRRSHPQEYAQLMKKVDGLVLDEGQLVDNDDTLRSEAVRDIGVPVVWVLTATPYQSQIKRFFTLLNYLDPRRFSDEIAFIEIYTQSTDGLRQLHTDLADLLLRRTKDQTVPYFENPTQVPFDEQFRNHKALLPRKRMISPTERGSYTLHPDQEDVIYWMVSDFEGWARNYNLTIAVPGKQIDIAKLNPFQKFSWIHKAIYQPEEVGLQIDNPLYAALDREVEGYIKEGKKLILWEFNTALIDKLCERYSSHGVARIDGQVSQSDKDSARHAYQETSEAKILVGNRRSGGVGLTLTAGDVAILVQLPLAFPELYQIEGRNNRVIGVQNIRHAKVETCMQWMMPKFSEQFLKRVEGSDLADVFRHGTLVEQTYERLEGGRVIYNFVLDGYGDPQEVQRYFQTSLLEGLGLRERSEFDVKRGLRDSTRRLFELAEAFSPVWAKVKEDQESEQLVCKIIDQGRRYSDYTKAIAEALQKIEAPTRKDLQFVASLFELDNRYLTEQLLATLPQVITNYANQGKHLPDVLPGKLDLIGTLPVIAEALSGDNQPIVNLRLLNYLSSQRDHPEARALKEQFLLGMFNILSLGSAQSIAVKNADLIANDKPETQVRFYFHLGMAAALAPDLVRANINLAPRSPAELFSSMEEIACRALDQFVDAPLNSTLNMLRREKSWSGKADHLLALASGWKKRESDQMIKCGKTALLHVIEGNYRKWRLEEASNDELAPIRFLDENRDFWDSIATNATLKRETITINPELVRKRIVRSYGTIIKEVRLYRATHEGVVAQNILDTLDRVEPGERDSFISRCRSDAQKLGRALGEVAKGKRVDSDEVDSILNRYEASKPSDNSPLALKEIVYTAKRELDRAIEWIDLEAGISDLKAGQGLVDPKVIKGILSRKESFYNQEGREGIAERFRELRVMVEEFEQVQTHGADRKIVVSITETDDPAIITRMGALRPDMTNCFNPHGNPIFTKTVIGALGSKNFKMLIVRDEHRNIIASASYKVRSRTDGTPVLFLERGLSSMSYDFRDEMLALLNAKAEEMGRTGIKPIVAYQALDKKRDSDIVVYGTGGFTGVEYAEAVFHLRSAKRVAHAARIYDPDNKGDARQKQIKGKASQMERVIGIGHSNLSARDFLKKLKGAHVSKVIDVRAAPYSRRFPQFNRDELAAFLREHGIEYRWMGDSLGNRVDPNGERSLKGFESYMTTAEYQHGIEELVTLVGESDEKVAICCAEKNEEDCHRKYIIADLAKRFGICAGGNGKQGMLFEGK